MLSRQLAVLPGLQEETPSHTLKVRQAVEAPAARQTAVLEAQQVVLMEEVVLEIVY